MNYPPLKFEPFIAHMSSPSYYGLLAWGCVYKETPSDPYEPGYWFVQIPIFVDDLHAFTAANFENLADVSILTAHDLMDESVIDYKLHGRRQGGEYEQIPNPDYDPDDPEEDYEYIQGLPIYKPCAFFKLASLNDMKPGLSRAEPSVIHKVVNLTYPNDLKGYDPAAKENIVRDLLRVQKDLKGKK